MLHIIENHLESSRLFTKDDIKELLKNYSEAKYQGSAYRILLFSNEVEGIPDISEDICFSKDIDSLKYYARLQDGEYYKYAIIYKINILEGFSFDLFFEKYNNLVNQLTCPIPDEGEVNPLIFNNTEVIFQGLYEDLFIKL